MSARHTRDYLRLAEECEPRINTRDRQACLALLEREHPNLRMATERASRAGQHDDASRLATALFWDWFHRGHWREGRETPFLDSAVHYAAGPTRSRARALLGDGVLAWAEGDLAGAGPRLEECAAIGASDSMTCPPRPTHCIFWQWCALPRAIRRPAGRWESRRSGWPAQRRTPFVSRSRSPASVLVLLALEEYDNARATLEESAARGRETGDAWAVALPLRNLAIIAHRQRDYPTARRLLEESLHGLESPGREMVSLAQHRDAGRGLGERW